MNTGPRYRRRTDSNHAESGMKIEIIGDATLYTGCCIKTLAELPEKSINTCITSPPYFGLRDYGNDGQIGLEATPDDYVDRMVEVFREVRRVLRDDGTVWLNLGDSYVSNGKGGNTYKTTDDKRDEMGQKLFGGGIRKELPPGLKQKDIIGIPWRVAFALQADGWYLRQDIIWRKPNPMPESVTDRCTKAHEYIFLLSKSARYYYDADAIKEPARWDGKSGTKNYRPSAEGGRIDAGMNSGGATDDRNKRSVWTVTTKPYKGAHFATFPPDLIEPCVLAGCPQGGTVLDPFSGSGTTGQVALENNRKYVGIELNQEYQDLAIERIGSAKYQGVLFA